MFIPGTRKDECMKQQKNRATSRASKRVRRRRLSTQSQSSKSKAHGIEVEKQVEIIAKAIVDATVEYFTRDQFPKDVTYWGLEGLWLQYLGRCVDVQHKHFLTINSIFFIGLQQCMTLMS